MAALKPFKISVPDEQLRWINDRVKTARIPNGKDLTGEALEAFGLPTERAQNLHKYWVTKYDWRSVEKTINEEMTMFTLPIEHNGEELTIHFVFHKSEREDAIPLLFLHGWPGTFLEARKVLRPLTSPASAEDPAFHVIAPSLPGFGFSSYPTKPCSPMAMGAIMNKLMLALKFERYMAQGGDWGSIIARSMALDFPNNCRALHLNFVPATPPSPLRDPISVGKLGLAWLTGGWNLTSFENKLLKRMQWWYTAEFGYAQIQGTKPQTISYALSDSPFGQVCWIRDKIDQLIAPETIFDEEETITWCMPYIINGSSGPAEIYKWTQKPWSQQMGDAIFSRAINATVSVGCSNFPYDVMYVPKWWAQSTVAKNITFWKEHDRGGHFVATEVPQILVEDVRTFTKDLDVDVLQSLRATSGTS